MASAASRNRCSTCRSSRTSHSIVQHCSRLRQVAHAFDVEVEHPAAHREQPQLHRFQGGVVAFTKTIAFELAAKGIRANVVCPGTTDTPMVRALLEKSPDAVNRNLGAVPMGRLAKAEEIADMIVFLTGPASAFVTGTSIPVDGGRTRH